MSQHFFEFIEEELALEFNGKISIRSKKDKTLLGSIIINNGVMWNAAYGGKASMNAIFHIYIDDMNSLIEYKTNPEIIEDSEQNIHYPFGVIKKKIAEKFELYQKSLKNRPPDGVRLMINSDFIATGDKVSSEEFVTLSIVSDYNLVRDIYKNCQLFESDITMALVSLRKKGALKVLAKRKR